MAIRVTAAFHWLTLEIPVQRIDRKEAPRESLEATDSPDEALFSLTRRLKILEVLEEETCSGVNLPDVLWMSL